MLVPMRTYIGYILIALVLCGGAFLLFFGLGDEPLLDYDEAAYGEIVREGLSNGEFLSFTFLGEPFLQKPPVQFWRMMISSTIFEDEEFALRFPSALTGFLVLVLTMLITYHIARDTYAAALAGAILVTTAHFADISRQALFDVPVVFSNMAALYFFLLALRNHRWFLLMGAALGISILTKSIFVLFALIAIAAFIVFYKRSDIFRDAYFWGSIALAALIALPWHLYEYARFGSEFIRIYVSYNIFERLGTDLLGSSPSLYLRYLYDHAALWSGVFLLAVGAAIGLPRRLRPEIRSAALSCVAAIAIILVLLSIVQTRIAAYLVSVYPLAAIVIALTISELLKTTKRTWMLIAGIVLLLISAFLVTTQWIFSERLHSTPFALAREGKTIGTYIDGSGFYAYEYRDLQTIMYYSNSLHPLALTPESPLPAGTFIVMKTADEERFRREYPVRLEAIYFGSLLRLYRVE